MLVAKDYSLDKRLEVQAFGTCLVWLDGEEIAKMNRNDTKLTIDTDVLKKLNCHFSSESTVEEYNKVARD